MDATGRACEARAPFDAACQAVPVDADSGIVAIEDRLDDRGERSRRVVLRVGTVGDPGPAPRVPGRRRPWESSASRLLSTPQSGVLLRTLKDHVARPLQFVSGTHKRVEIVGETAWDTGGDDQVVPGGAESVRGTVQSALPQCVKPALRRERAVADAARLRRETGHGAMMALSVGRHDHVSVPGQTTTQDETALTVNTRTSACADTVLLPPRGTNADAFGRAEEVTAEDALVTAPRVRSVSQLMEPADGPARWECATGHRCTADLSL